MGAARARGFLFLLRKLVNMVRIINIINMLYSMSLFGLDDTFPGLRNSVVVDEHSNIWSLLY